MVTDYTARLHEFARLLVEHGIAGSDNIVGCTEDDLTTFRADVGPLPAAYEAFLRLAGRGAGGFWAGSDAFFPQLLRLRLADLEELAEDCGTTLPRHSKLVFFSHQGYEMLWMSDPATQHDPPVWQLLEGAEGGPRRLASSFTALLLDNAHHMADRRS
jgi:hypothetical protein